MKRLLIITPLYPPQTGGPATVSRFLEESMQDQGWSVRLARFDVFMKYSSGLRHALFFISLFSKIRWAHQVVVLDTVSVGYPAMWACRIMRKPYVVRVPGDYAWEQGVQRYGVKDLLDDYSAQEPVVYGRDVARLARMQAQVAQHAHKVVAQTQYLAEIIKGWAVMPEDIVTIPNAFGGRELHTSRDKLRKERGWSREESVILTAGRMIPWKGFIAVIDALEDVQADNIRLVILGEGPDRARVMEYVQSKPYRDRIEMIERLDHQDTLHCLRAADCFVLNTAYEGIANFLQEAMAMGSPVVTTRQAGNADWIHDAGNALVVEYNNRQEISRAINRIIGDQSLRESLVEGGKTSLEQFDYNRVIERWVSLLGT